MCKTWHEVLRALVAICVLTKACSSLALQAPTSSVPVESISSTGSEDLFPRGVLDEPNAKWWTHVLQICGESALRNHSGGDSSTASFRLVKRSLTGNPAFLVVRVYTTGAGNALIVVKQVSFDGTILSSETRQLQQAQFETLKKAIDDSLWTATTEDRTPRNQRIKDGGTFLIEGLEGSKYHVAWRRTHEQGPVNDIEEHIISIAFQR